MIKNTILLFIFSCLCLHSFGQKFSIGIGFNKQYHRMRYLKDELPHQEVNKQFLVSPSLYLACKLNKRFFLAFDISYLKYSTTIKTNFNFNNPNDTSANIATLNYEKTPILFSKLSYKIYKTKNDIKFFVSAGCSFSYQKKNDSYSGYLRTADSSISGSDYNLRPSYMHANFLIGLQINLPLSDRMSINFSLNNVFGGKNYLFEQKYSLYDHSNTNRRLEYGLFGGFAYFDFKLAYNFNNKAKKAKAMPK